MTDLSNGRSPARPYLPHVYAMQRVDELADYGFADVPGAYGDLGGLLIPEGAALEPDGSAIRLGDTRYLLHFQRQPHADDDGALDRYTLQAGEDAAPIVVEVPFGTYDCSTALARMQHGAVRRACSVSCCRVPAPLVAALLLVLSACASAPPPPPAHSDALWRLIETRLPGGGRPAGQLPAGGDGGGPARRAGQDAHGDYQFLLMPLDKVTGIESHGLYRRGAPNYFAAAWQAARIPNAPWAGRCRAAWPAWR